MIAPKNFWRILAIAVCICAKNSQAFSVPQQSLLAKKKNIPLGKFHSSAHKKSQRNNNNQQQQTTLWAASFAADDLSSSSFQNHTSDLTGLSLTGTTSTSSSSSSSIEQQQAWKATSGGESKETSSSSSPSYRELMVFTATTIIIWLSEPLLSLVDTTVVSWAQASAKGGASVIHQLASLGPATTLMDSLLYLTYFLGIATTNLISKHRAIRDYRKLQQTTSHVLGVALMLGLATTILVWTVGMPLLTSLAGTAAVESPSLVSWAYRYSFIRAGVGMASVGGLVAQALCLATFDTRTPALAVAAASVVNVVGDVLLAPRHGVVGAAMATAAATLASTAILFRAVRKQMRTWRRQELEEAENNTNDDDGRQSSSAANILLSSTKVSENITTTATNAVVTADEDEEPSIPSSHDAASADHNSKQSKQLPAVPFVSFPDRPALKEFFQLSGPIFLVILAKVACYGAMTLRVTDFGVTPLAAHNILMRLFFFFACFGDAVSQTAQSYLPATLYQKSDAAATEDESSSLSSAEQTQKLPKHSKPFRKLLTKLVVLATVLGVGNSLVCVGLVRQGAHWFSTHPQIIHLLQTHAPAMGIALALHPMIMALEGSVIAAREFGTLVTTYAVTLVLHFGILQYFGGSFGAVWRTLGIFQTIRLVNFVARRIDWQKRLSWRGRRPADAY